jgi:hypothetical protein
VKENGGPGNFVNYMPEDVIASVDRAQVLNKMPDKCYAIHSKVHFDCAISSTHAKVNHSNGINFSVTGKNFSRESAVIPGGGSPQKNESLNDAFEMHLYAPKSCQVGSISQRVSLYALDEKTSQSGAREVLALTFEPKVVFESKDSRASLGKAKVTSLETDTIIAYRSDVTLDINYLAESMDLWDDYTSDDHCN